MKIDRLKALVLFSVSCGLSCTVWPPTLPEPGLPEVSAAPVSDSPLGPDEVEWVEAHFLRYLTGLAEFEVRRVAETIVAESERLGLDLDLVLAVIHTESSFHNFARSQVGALGLMQIMPDTGEMLARELDIPWQGPRTLFDPSVNVRMGTQYLSFLYSKYGNWDGALAAYNWGPQRIDRRLRSGRALPARYVKKVTARLESTRQN